MFSHRTNWQLSPNRFTQALEETRRAGKKILDLSASNPTRIGLHYDERAILGALASSNSLDYDPQSKGLRAARAAVADYYRNEHGVCDLDPGRLILTSSTSEGYSYVFSLLCNPGDELLVPKPSYPLFDFLADLEDVKLVPYPLIYDHGWQMDFPSLERAVTPRTRGVIIVHPNNPTGSYVQQQELTLLNAFCRKHNLALIVDEVFLDYSHDRKKRRTFAVNADVLTFTLSGLSKISALPQMKVAWMVASGPAEEVDTAMARLEVIADTYLSVNAPIQWALPALLDQRHSIQEQLLERVLANLAELDRQLAAQKACERLKLEGGWYAVLRVPVTKSDEDLAIHLLREKSVLMHPGHFYDFPGDGHLVLSLITLEEEFKQGIVRVIEELLIADC
ncbi:MAG: pyridoxal phosphate-dependent aminotransferase [Candidatus Sulfotelmatobacter sp.]